MASLDRITELQAELAAKNRARGEARKRDAANAAKTAAEIDALIAEDPDRIARLNATKAAKNTESAEPKLDQKTEVPPVGASGTSEVIDQIQQHNHQDDGDALTQAIDDINSEYFITMDGGKVVVVHEGDDHELGGSKLSYLSQEGFCLLYKNRSVRIGDSLKNIATVWLSSPQRREYPKGVALLPGKQTPDGVYNLWSGWGVDPLPGNSKPMLSFVEKVICDNDAVAYGYLIGWLARAVQYPDAPAEVAVVLKGGRGSGKGTLGRAFIKLFGSHGKHILHPRHLVGHFNTHLRTALGLFVDEAYFVGDRSGGEILKGLITEPTRMNEPKGIDAYDVRNRTKIVMATNASWAVPAGADERRYFVLEVSEVAKQQHAYFEKLNTHLDNGGLGAFLHFLLAYDISAFNIRDVPSTRGLVQEKLQSLDPFHTWIAEKLWRGVWYEHEEVWEQQRVRDEITREFTTYCRDKGHRYENVTGQSVGKRLSKLFPSSRDARLKVDGTRRWCRILPDLDQARREFEQSALGGDRIDWPTEIEEADEEG